MYVANPPDLRLNASWSSSPTATWFVAVGEFIERTVAGATWGGTPGQKSAKKKNDVLVQR